MFLVSLPGLDSPWENDIRFASTTCIPTRCTLWATCKWWLMVTMVAYLSSTLIEPLLYAALIRNRGTALYKKQAPCSHGVCCLYRVTGSTAEAQMRVQAGQCESEGGQSYCGTPHRLPSYHFCSWTGSFTILSRFLAEAKGLEIQRNISRKGWKQDYRTLCCPLHHRCLN